MNVVSAQISVYPLRQTSIGPPIREAVRAFRAHGLSVRVDEMSTSVWGREETLFAALQEAWRRAAACGDTVMSVTLSNACPAPEASE
jgi:uncharacterized protein YqgV (UPF0045/DUF77 family)